MPSYDEIQKEKKQERDKQTKHMKSVLYDFCECENAEGVSIWDFGKDELCQLYGDGIKCPLANMSQRHRDPAVNNCTFNSPEYSFIILKDVYEIVEKFVSENPNYKEGKLGKPEELEHDNTYQQWAPGGGVD